MEQVLKKVQNKPAVAQCWLLILSLEASASFIDWLIVNVQTEAKEKYVAFVSQLKEKHGVKE